MKENELLKVKTDIEEEKMKKNEKKKITQKGFPRLTASNGSSKIQH